MTDQPSLEEQVGALLRQNGFYLTIAESFTGGLIADRITDVPGCSEYFIGGMVSYSNESKLAWLGVQAQTLQQHGAVSRACVLEMARGIRHTLQQDFCPHKVIGLAVSGIAGPSGGTAQKPVGTVWIAVNMEGKQKAQQHVFSGSRREIKAQSAEAALTLLLKTMQ